MGAPNDSNKGIGRISAQAEGLLAARVLVPHGAYRDQRVSYSPLGREGLGSRIPPETLGQQLLGPVELGILAEKQLGAPTELGYY